VKKVKIGGLLDLSTVDYPGKAACVIFMYGCNFRCPFCYNPDLINGEYTEIEIEKLFELVKKNNFVDAVVITGGEPTLQEELFDLCKLLKENNYLVKLDTNGSNPEMVDKLIKNKLVDYIALDVKGPVDERYLGVVRIKNMNIINKIKETMNILKNSGVEFEFRTPLVPGLNDFPEYLKKQSEDVKDAKNFVLEQFTPENGTLDKEFEKIKSPSPGEMKKAADYFKNENVKIKSRNTIEEPIKPKCVCS